MSNPPSGTASAYTIIRAENDGGAILKGYNTAVAINAKSYIQLEGFTIKDGIGAHAIVITDSHHIKVMRVGIKNGAAWNTTHASIVQLSSLDGVTGTTDCLLEDVWVVGVMRYGILIGGSAAYSERNILRRCVVRFDGSGSGQPHAGISNYGVTTGIQGARNNLVQNCITIDFNPADNPTGEGIYAGFYNPHAATNIDFYGCIALKTRERGWLLNEDTGSTGNDMYNCVVWEPSGYGIVGQRGTAPGSILDQVTVGGSPNHGYVNWNSVVATIRNSLFYGNGSANSGVTLEEYNHYWNNSVTGTNALSTNPLMKYITQIEANSPAYQSGKNGATRGATIVKRYGVSGTLYGEAGYGTLTNDNLWPFPYEQRIHDLFAEPDGISEMPGNNEARGFAAPGQSLTNYIWNYLGNGNPYPDTPDTTSPSVSITNPTGNATVSGLVSVAASASDNIGVSRVEFIINGAVRATAMSAPYAYNWDTAAETNGIFGIQAKAYDAAGNTNTSAISVTVNNVSDIIPPTVNLTAPANGAALSGSVNVTATATDDVAVSRVQFLIDGVVVSTDTASPYSYSWDTASTANGAHTVAAKAFDAKGNNASSAAGVTVSNSIQVVIPASSTWKYLDNGSNQGTAWRGTSFDDSSWASGAAEFGYGNGDEATVVGFGPDAASKYITTYFRRTFNLADAASVTSLALQLRRDDGAVVYLNGTEVLRSNMPAGAISNTTLAAASTTGSGETDYFTASLSPSLLVSGVNVLAVEVHQDDVTSSDISFNAGLTANAGGAIDSTVPTVTLTAPTNGATVSGTVSLTATASDNVAVSRVEFSVDGVLKNSDAAAPFSYSWNTAAETNGSHTLTARAYDAAGNSASHSAAVTVSNAVADATPPTVSIAAPANGSTLSGSVNVAASAADNAGVNRVEFYVDGNLKNTDAVAPYSYSWNTAAETNAAHTVAVRAYDAAGNAANASINVTVSNLAPGDTTPPTVAITAPANGSKVQGIVTVTANASDNAGVARVEFFVDGLLKAADLSSPYEYLWDSRYAANGNHTIMARAYDSSGNNSSSSVTVYKYRTKFRGVKSVTLASASPLLPAAPATPTVGNNVLISVVSDDPAFAANTVAARLRLPSGDKDVTLARGSGSSVFCYVELPESAISLSEIQSLNGQEINILVGSENIIAQVESDVISPELGGTISESNPSGAWVIIAPNALTEEAQLAILPEPSLTEKQRSDALLSQNLISLGEGREISFVSSGSITSATIQLPYNAALLPAGYSASQIRIAYFNPQTGKWEVQSAASVNGNTVQTTVTHFSLYKPVLEVADAAGLSGGESYVYPNPSISPDEPVVRASLGDVIQIGLKIYDAAGKEVYTAQVPATPAGYSSGRAYYDHAWTEPKASGMYLALMEGKTASGSVVRSRSNFAVVR